MTTPNKVLDQPAYNSNVNTWGTGPLNTNFGYIDLALGGSTLLNSTGLGGTTVALSAAQCIPLSLVISGTPGGITTYSVPAGTGGQWVLRNGTTGGYAVRVQSASGGTYVTINAGDNVQVSCDGTAAGMVRNDTTASAGGATTQVQYNNAGVLAGSANMTFNGTVFTAHTLDASTGGVIFPDNTTQTTAAAPAGSDTQVQFNDGGAFAGDAGLVFNKTTNALTTTGLLTAAGATLSSTLTMTAAAVNGAVRVDVASATTCAIGAAASNYVRITGTTTITGLGTVASGTYRDVVFDGALTLTYNATSLILPGLANIITAAGDTAGFVSDGAGNWKCLWYTRASGASVTGAVLQRVSSVTGAYSANAATIPVDNTTPQNTEGTELLSLAITPKSATSKLVVNVTTVLGCTTSIDTGAVALFQDSGANAIAANPCSLSGFAMPITLQYEVVSGSTTARTFKVRAGCNTNTLLFNGVNTVGAIMNGLCQSFISITEIAA
jgi:hypothetical protein